MARFYIGQPVLCINDEQRPGVARRFPGLVWPRRGVVYHVRWNFDSNAHPHGVLTFVGLREIRNRNIMWPGRGVMHEAGFWEERFEPATDISVFEQQRETVEIMMGEPEPVEETQSEEEDA